MIFIYKHEIIYNFIHENMINIFICAYIKIYICIYIIYLYTLKREAYGCVYMCMFTHRYVGREIYRYDLDIIQEF